MNSNVFILSIGLVLGFALGYSTGLLSMPVMTMDEKVDTTFSCIIAGGKATISFTPGGEIAFVACVFVPSGRKA